MLFTNQYRSLNLKKDKSNKETEIISKDIKS